MLFNTIKFIPLGASLAMAGLVTGQHIESRQASNYGDSGASQGCYSSPGGGMVNQGYATYQSSGLCGPLCDGMNKPVFATQGYDCYCGNLLPSLSDKVPDYKCGSGCPGIDTEQCGGGSKYFNVYISSAAGGTLPHRVSDDGGDSSSSSSTSTSSTSSTSSTTKSTSKTRTPNPTPTHHGHKHTHKPPKPHKPSVSTTTGTSTIYKPAPTPDNNGAEQTSSPSSSSSSSSSSMGKTVGIAVGVIGGVIVFAGLIAGILFYLRRRRRMKNAENGHRRADSMNAYTASTAQTPSTLAGKMQSPHPPSIAINDSRLDPWVMRETRRESGASFLADNQDYSRRILKVTNPDSS